MTQSEKLEQMRVVKDLYEKDLMQIPNVVGVGIGLREREGELTDEPVIVVSVVEKSPMSQIDPQELIPSELDGVPVDVQAVGKLGAL
jgi:hypothetical protein